MLESAALRAALLAQNGYSGKLIQQQVLRYDGAEYSLSALYHAIRKTGTRIKDYRDGIGEVAEANLHRLFRHERPAKRVIRHIQHPKRKRNV